MDEEKIDIEKPPPDVFSPGAQGRQGSTPGASWDGG
jgi:hypothetical protein